MLQGGNAFSSDILSVIATITSRCIRQNCKLTKRYYPFDISIRSVNCDAKQKICKNLNVASLKRENLKGFIYNKNVYRVFESVGQWGFVREQYYLPGRSLRITVPFRIVGLFVSSSGFNRWL